MKRLLELYDLFVAPIRRLQRHVDIQILWPQCCRVAGEAGATQQLTCLGLEIVHPVDNARAALRPHPMAEACKHCQSGWLENRFGEDVECVNGVLIDIDIATEGWARDMAYRAAPCEACPACSGTGDDNSGECRSCNSTGWRSGEDESQNRLAEWAAPSDG